MNPAVLQRTQDSLGRVIRKPPLTERLLSKPPFRYLHDVITEVIRVTDFMKGLYTDSELKSDNVKDKEAKINFLQKAVDVVTLVLGEQLSVKPARVVAGHEPEKTNELLQAIGKCCLSKLSSEDAVRKVLAGEKSDPKGKLSTSKSQDKENRESKEDERKSQKDREERKASEIRDRSASRERKEREHVKDEDRRRNEKERERTVEKEPIREDERADRDKNRGKMTKPEREKDKSREKDRERGHEKDRRSDGGKGKERDKDKPKEREKEKGKERDKEQERDHERRRDRPREAERGERKSKVSEENTMKRAPEGPVGDTKIDPDKELSSPPKNTKSYAGRPARRPTKFGTDGRKEAKPLADNDLDRKAKKSLAVKSLGRKEPLRRGNAGSMAEGPIVIAAEERGRRFSNKVPASGSTSDEKVASAQGERGAEQLGMKEPSKRQAEVSLPGEPIAIAPVETTEKGSSAEQLGALESQGQGRGDRISDEKASGEKKLGETTAAQIGDSGSDAEEEEKPLAAMNGDASEDLPPHVTQRRIPRPNSARPAPPRVKRQGSAEISPPERVSSGKLVPSVIVDKQKEDDDEDEQFVVEEAALLPPEMPEMETDSAVELNEDEKHGGLVKRILETKKDYEAQQPLSKSTEKLPISETGRKKEKDLVSKEIEKLRTSIQTLCRSALPLGKIMDYIQEDMDAMQNELQMWRSENKLHGESLLREQSITDSAVEPLRIELTDLEQLIKEQQDKICAVKANILKNEEKIQKMVFSISASSRT
ncbi:TRAF3-interacting protein 1 isoform X1 [Ambystoma mexicanum]|uniref:TRAF3-interacting protein 1 isoform X1 n=1 Tax=Ambystoma mexicanum TaxID=8296 RepID=UPI0037E87FAE